MFLNDELGIILKESVFPVLIMYHLQTKNR
jgi:hypothetical protein